MRSGTPHHLGDPPKAGPVFAIAVLTAALALVGSHARADENLPPKDVLAVMVKRRLEIRKLCWEDSKERADTSLRVDFTVAQSGVVTDVTAREVVGPASIAACVVAEVKRTTFVSSQKGGRFRWPFIFKGP